ncbi:hypothetical protein BO86DRAFT_82888 [Aspergillus japonicus CBS 114.51]|uniref:Uncharacterized protein n=2 Tax=Aspergillus TaxID=5052 RepID=A0A2V5H334_ASPV1|nr:hypothetical protein BO86DRAFT_82888 [Aspergillus japonicus CBS 114.51]PYI16282.1 hypothetical protein BO99DRAFT_227380 [Aspergillus violaceofuscus CBS 115571]RAH82385.1 hypothetical protein BO86DRAFT_82888 [Aspergillus japonicus CBS 114.51]
MLTVMGYTCLCWPLWKVPVIIHASPVCHQIPFSTSFKCPFNENNGSDHMSATRIEHTGFAGPGIPFTGRIHVSTFAMAFN